MALTDAERRTIRSRIAMTLANLQQADIYWLPSLRRITGRSLQAHHRRPHVVPSDAILLGRYCHPLPACVVLDDLCDMLTQEAAAAA